MSFDAMFTFNVIPVGHFQGQRTALMGVAVEFLGGEDQGCLGTGRCRAPGTTGVHHHGTLTKPT